ncbi:NAD(P)-dependent oxidoreductase [Streptomyces massasporeus]|uniref:NAD-dependent epimerase/dehydratase family protein n=1 Tax=Streptomyces massasporeus TaxID=67324 RepID=UPI0033D64F64
MTTNHTSQSVLLAGASGVLGRHITHALTEAGHKVTGLGRSGENGIRADLMDRDALLRAVDGHRFDTVIHAATALRKPPMRDSDMYATDALRIEGTAHLVEAARACGARRFVVESMVFGYGYGDHGDRTLTEDDPFGPPGRTPRLERHIAGMRTKERLAFGAEGLEGVALRFGCFYGPGGTDAARAVVAAVERGRPGQAYNIADDTPMGFRAHVEAVARTFGLPKPMTVPLWLMKPMSYAHTMMTSRLRVSTAKAESELGWRPLYASSGEGLAAMRSASRR